ncbi:Pseudouridine synthase [Planctomycetes bacterium Poly30]|uniref:Pseudouridine synthase n=1 Tax=Saltatorellus ferox TaxID=2528018 RepID=A0A518ER67_9BACT|nr:Pseudouridine synthase [Planctomycetes bacterium Poly30]
MAETIQTFEVAESLGGARLDVVLADAVSSWSRSRLQKAVKSGSVEVDGVPITRPNTAMKAGQKVSIRLDDERETSTDTRGGIINDLTVLYEDDEIAVIDKPAGLVTHPNPRQIAGTVSDLAVERYGPLPEVQGENRPGIVHRLDRLTSGVLVLGRTESALQNLKAQFQARTVQKTYNAIVHGVPRFDTEWLTGAIATSTQSPDRMRVVPEHLREDMLEAGEARTAETMIETLETFGFASFIAAMPKTGRTHQIRVHLLAAGMPILYDRVYKIGGAPKLPIPAGVPRMERPALHARRLEIDHPKTGERMTFEADLPADMAGLLAWMRAR